MYAACWAAFGPAAVVAQDAPLAQLFAQRPEISKPVVSPNGDFIAYAFAPSGICYLLPVAPLQRAWRQHGKEWIRRYGTRRAQNVGYVSVSVPVPKDVLMRAIAMAMIISSACSPGDL